MVGRTHTGCMHNPNLAYSVARCKHSEKSLLNWMQEGNNPGKLIIQVRDYEKVRELSQSHD